MTMVEFGNLVGIIAGGLVLVGAVIGIVVIALGAMKLPWDK